MAHSIETVPLMVTSPGVQRSIKVHRVGRIGARPKMYVQAALHANETPGLLIAHHVLEMLLAADRAGKISGEIVLVPFANPIGLADNVLGNQIGREALDGGGNYNRGWPDLTAAVKPLLEGKLGNHADANVAVIRQALATALDQLRPATEVVSMQIALLKLAIDADVVVDIHCELMAVAGIVIAPWSLPTLEPLIAELDPALVHLTDTPNLFDTTCSRTWADLAAAYGATKPIPQATVSTTIEMRGTADVSDELARRDALAIFNQAVRIGAIAGTVKATERWSGEVTPHESISMMRTPVGGVIVYPHPIGTHVEAGTVIAEIVDPAADDPANARTEIRAVRPGLIYAGVLNKLVRPNDIVIKIAATDFIRA
jgi:predicted deacylase